MLLHPLQHVVCFCLHSFGYYNICVYAIPHEKHHTITLHLSYSQVKQEKAFMTFTLSNPPSQPHLLQTDTHDLPSSAY